MEYFKLNSKKLYANQRYPWIIEFGGLISLLIVTFVLTYPCLGKQLNPRKGIEKLIMEVEHLIDLKED
jgi:hypothetical protein